MSKDFCTCIYEGGDNGPSFKLCKQCATAKELLKDDTTFQIKENDNIEMVTVKRIIFECPNGARYYFRTYVVYYCQYPVGKFKKGRDLAMDLFSFRKHILAKKHEPVNYQI